MSLRTDYAVDNTLRDEQIRYRFQIGHSVYLLAFDYCLSDDEIRRIIQDVRTTKTV
jgi:Mor family transcriptional regulator